MRLSTARRATVQPLLSASMPLAGFHRWRAAIAAIAGALMLLAQAGAPAMAACVTAGAVVTCSGTTTSSTAGYATTASSLTVNVQSNASMSGDVNGISVLNPGVIINNSGTVATTSTSSGTAIQGIGGSIANNGIITGPTAIDGDFQVSNTASGTIDGRILLIGGATMTLSNSGLVTISSPGAGAVHFIGDTFFQTSTGTLALRIASGSNDSLAASNFAYLDGTLRLMPTGGGFQPRSQTYAGTGTLKYQW